MSIRTDRLKKLTVQEKTIWNLYKEIKIVKKLLKQTEKDMSKSKNNNFYLHHSSVANNLKTRWQVLFNKINFLKNE